MCARQSSLAAFDVHRPPSLVARTPRAQKVKVRHILSTNVVSFTFFQRSGAARPPSPLFRMTRLVAQLLRRRPCTIHPAVLAFAPSAGGRPHWENTRYILSLGAVILFLAVGRSLRAS